MNKAQIQDADLIKSFALPASASATTTSAVIDLGAAGFPGQTVRPREVFASLDVPALSATIAPDTRTVTISVEQSDSSTFASGVDTLFSKVNTGADGAGIAIDSIQAALPLNGKRYVRGKVVFGASTTDGSAVSAAFSLKF